MVGCAQNTLVVMTHLLLTIPTHGTIRLRLRPDAAPKTVEHVIRLVKSGLFDDNSSFYRSDFVIQFGLHGQTKKKNTFPNLPVNETKAPGTTLLSNTRGKVSVAHWDVPDNGNSEYFILLKDSPHLDSAYGGYCVFAEVEEDDEDSWRCVEAIAEVIKTKGTHPAIESVGLVE